MGITNGQKAMAVTDSLRRAAVVWSAIVCFAVANGALRDLVLAPAIGRDAALLASGLLLSTVIVVAACWGRRWMDLRSFGRGWAVGLLWLLLTLAFETALGVAQGRSGSEIAQAYAFRPWNLWPLVVATTLLAPVVVAVFGARRGGRPGGETVSE